MSVLVDYVCDICREVEVIRCLNEPSDEVHRDALIDAKEHFARWNRSNADGMGFLIVAKPLVQK